MPGYDPVRDAGGSDRSSPPPNHHPDQGFRPSPSSSALAHHPSTYNDDPPALRRTHPESSHSRYGDAYASYGRPSMHDGVAGTSNISPRSFTTALPPHPREYARQLDHEYAAPHRYDQSPRTSLQPETPVRAARRSASIADLIAASEMSEAEHDRLRDVHRDPTHYREDAMADRSMSRSSSASGGFQSGAPASLAHGSSHPRIPHPSPHHLARSERSPSMAHLLNEGTAGAILDRPRSGSHSSVSSHVSHPPPQHHPSQMSPLGHPSAHASTGPAAFARDRGPANYSGVANTSGLPRVSSPTSASAPGIHAPALSTLHRGGSSPGPGPTPSSMHAAQPNERARYAMQPGSSSYGSASRSASYSHAYPSASSSPSGHPHPHLQPSPSHRFAVPDVPFSRSPESRRVPLPQSPTSMPSAHPGSTFAHTAASSWHGDEYEAPSAAGMPPPQVHASPRRGSLVNSNFHTQRYAQAATGHSIPPTPGSVTSHGGYPVTPGSRSLPPHTPNSAHLRPGPDGYEESNYFPRMDERVSSSYDPPRERSDSLTSPHLRQVEHASNSNAEHASNADYQHGYGDVHYPIRTPGSGYHANEVFHRNVEAQALPPTAASPSFGPQRRNQKLEDESRFHAVNGRRNSGEEAHSVEASHPYQPEERYAKSDNASAHMREDRDDFQRDQHQDTARRDSIGHYASDLSPAVSSSVRPDTVATSTATMEATTAQHPNRKRPRDASVASSRSGRGAEMADTESKVQAETAPEFGEETKIAATEIADAIVPLPRYAPTHRISPPRLVMRPIGIEEIDRKRARCRNTLRREWEQHHQTDSREALDEILRDFHTKLAARNGAKSSSNGHEQPSSEPKKRAIGDTLEDAEEVADHYNKRREVGVRGREESPIIALRKFNNWIKSVLVGTFARGRDPNLDGRTRARAGRILDLGCGKGGDLKKWEKVRPSGLVGADIASVSIEQAIARHRDNNSGYPGDFFAFDCFSMALTEVIPRELLEPMFDNVTLQFCMHYAWESVEKARTMLDNVARYLRKGGVFIGTIPDSRELRDRMAASANPVDRSIGNRYYKVVFDQIERWPAFGHRYTFFLEDAVENVPEYVVDFDTFEDLAHEVGLRCIYRKNFAEIYHEGSQHHEYGKLLERMKVVDRYGSLSLDEEMWQAATLYLGFAFEKM